MLAKKNTTGSNNNTAAPATALDAEPKSAKPLPKASKKVSENDAAAEPDRNALQRGTDEIMSLRQEIDGLKTRIREIQNKLKAQHGFTKKAVSRLVATLEKDEQKAIAHELEFASAYEAYHGKPWQAQLFPESEIQSQKIISDLQSTIATVTLNADSAIAELD